MFEQTDLMLNTESCSPSNISYKSFKTMNLPKQKFILRSQKLWFIIVSDYRNQGIVV